MTLSEESAEMPPPGTEMAVSCVYCRQVQYAVMPDEGDDPVTITHCCPVGGPDWPCGLKLTWRPAMSDPPAHPV